MKKHTLLAALLWGASAGAVALIPGSASAPPLAAAGKQGKTRSISAKDKAQGAQYHPELLAEFGGAYAGPQATYVRALGQKIALQSGLSNSENDFTVTLLNSPVENAFAIPGGYVYITRQLFALANDEAEVAGVMGHEVGHVAEKHARGRSRAATGTGILAAAVGILTGSEVLADAAGQFGQMMTMSYSRSQETESDDLGVKYLAAAGYDPMAMASMLASLAATTALEARIQNQDDDSMPRWARTHPDPGARVKRATEKARATGITNGVRNRDAYMRAVDGIRYDDDPAEGIVDGQNFRHPVLKIGFTAPNGYVMTNSPVAVSVQGSGGQAEMTSVPYSGDLSAYVNAAFAHFTDGEVQAVQGTRAGRINGMRTAYATASANTQSGPVDITVYAFEISATEAYHFVLITPQGTGIGPFASMVQSMRRLTTAEAAQIKGRRIQVVTVKAGDTSAILAARMAYSQYQLERFLVLNGLASSARLTPGQKVKIVVTTAS